MQIKIIILSFILFGCGKEVSIDTKKLESYSTVTEAESNKTKTDGILIRTSSSSKLKIDDKTYEISRFSSNLTFDFIAVCPIGEIPVKFRGTVQSTEVVVERIEKK